MVKLSSNEESWGTAVAYDSTHAADLTFSYKAGGNKGTEYAREIGGLAFNVFIRRRTRTPGFTYFVAPDIGGARQVCQLPAQ